MDRHRILSDRLEMTGNDGKFINQTRLTQVLKKPVGMAGMTHHRLKTNCLLGLLAKEAIEITESK